MLSRGMLLGMVALAVTGCATGSGYAVDPRVGGDAASYSMIEEARQCEQQSARLVRSYRRRVRLERDRLVDMGDARRTRQRSTLRGPAQPCRSATAVVPPGNRNVTDAVRSF